MNTFCTYVAASLCLLLLAACYGEDLRYPAEPVMGMDSALIGKIEKKPQIFSNPFESDVPVRRYFYVIDSLVLVYDSLTPYALTEHLLIRANPRILDTLVATDYYQKMESGIFVYDQQALTIFRKGDSLLIPDSLLASQLISKQQLTRIDINIPEFKLRIIEGADTLYTFPVRVGLNHTGYLAVTDRTTDWRTKTGAGEITATYRDPIFRNFQTGKEYEYTRRDDGKTTLMPQIPTLEPEINGRCEGQLIHATTNPASLGKAYSHGCIGTREGDAWRIYYHAPVGTRIFIRYDLEIIDVNGDTTMLEDIYRR